jgi:hypothetical protein
MGVNPMGRRSASVFGSFFWDEGSNGGGQNVWPYTRLLNKVEKFRERLEQLGRKNTQFGDTP